MTFLFFGGLQCATLRTFWLLGFWQGQMKAWNEIREQQIKRLKKSLEAEGETFKAQGQPKEVPQA